MRIIQLITRPQRRGAEIFAVQLAECLKIRGHELWVISLLEGPGGLSFSEGLIKMDFKNRPKLDYEGYKELAATIKKIKPDIIQANASDTLRYAVGAKYLCSSKFKLVYRNANMISSFIRGKSQLYFNKILHSNVDAVISVSENSRLDYQKLFKPNMITSIPIGIDPKEIDKKLLQEMFQIDKDYLLFVGSLVPEKDPLGLLKIYSEVLKTYPKINLVYLGSGPLRKHLESEIAVLGLTKSVQIIPNQKNIFPILSKAKALVMASKIEGLPSVILEAMYCEIPVIAYRVGGIPEVLKNGGTGWSVNVGDQTSFENSILDVMNLNKDALETITQKAKDQVLENYQNIDLFKKFEVFYENLLQ
ncbi:glycosyltransferase [Algoriphagus machipongonensis]|uniref:Glycosyl transferase, group 1 family n=1 Tax=Algoriphagus machipongonensis TaxID=388413 RepID=A3HRJ2_9BACT|nr:glycosyltransferase [Algoriphagus machipongonensis]EAZ82460.1 glycosyl transferase, group 1 family [Algoriphagus machipongonensis]